MRYAHCGRLNVSINFKNVYKSREISIQFISHHFQKIKLVKGDESIDI